jgi:hypothetical protein
MGKTLCWPLSSYTGTVQAAYYWQHLSGFFFLFLTLVSKLKINKNSKTIKIIFNFMSFSNTFFKEKI